MYHNHFTPPQRVLYLQLLAQAEQDLSKAFTNAQALANVIRAASAVRGSEAVLSRIKPPFTPQQHIILTDLLHRSRRYVQEFWPEANTPASSSPSVGGSPANTHSPALGGSTVKQKVAVNSTSQPPKQPVPPSTPTSPALGGSPAKPTPTLNSQLSTLNSQLSNSPLQHLDQYLPLLSPKLQHQAAVLQQKYAALNDAHETLSRLTRQALSSPSPASSPAVGGSPAKPIPISPSLRRELSYYAQQVDHLVRIIDTFWLQVHAERQALEGKPVTPEYKTYLDQLAAKFPMEEPLRTWGEYTKEEIEAMANYSPTPALGGSPAESPSSSLHPTLQALGCTIDELTQARIIRDKKLLRVKPPQKVTERAKSLRIQAMEELHAWGQYIEKAQKECLEKMGIEVPEDYLSPFLAMTEEERRDRKRAHDRANYHRHKPLAVKLGIAKKQKEDQKNDNPYKPDS